MPRRLPGRLPGAVPFVLRGRFIWREMFLGADKELGLMTTDSCKPDAEGDIEVIARGVCVQEGSVLVCHSIGASNTYLPGGHVEFGESARAALARELLEEAGVNVHVGNFIAVVENIFVQNGSRHSEVNLIFEMSLPPELSIHDVESREEKIEFMTSELETLAGSAIEPSLLREMVRAWVRGEAVPPFVSYRETG